MGIFYEEALSDAKNLADEEELSIVLFNIAEMYERGYGMKVNLKKATQLYEESAVYGLEEAKERLNNLKNQIKK